MEGVLYKHIIHCNHANPCNLYVLCRIAIHKNMPMYAQASAWTQSEYTLPLRIQTHAHTHTHTHTVGGMMLSLGTAGVRDSFLITSIDEYGNDRNQGACPFFCVFPSYI